MSSVMEYINNNVYLTTIINIAVTIIFGFLLIKLCKKTFKYGTKRNGNVVAIHRKFLYQLLECAIVIVCVYCVFEQIPAMSSFVNIIATSSSLLVVVLGFAAQEALGDVINGLFISIFKPFEIGDRVKLVSLNITGIIEDITLRHTVIKNIENKRLVIPNSVMNKETIENADFKDDEVCNFLDVSVSYESDIALAMKTIRKLAEKHRYFVDYRKDADKEKGMPAVPIFVRDLGSNGIDLRCHIWTRTTPENFVMCSDLRLQIVDEFKRKGIEIPYMHLCIVDSSNKEEK